MKPLGDRTRDSNRALYLRCGAVLVILLTAIPLGKQPARSGDAIQAMQPGAGPGRPPPPDLVRSSVSQVLAAVQSPTAAGSESTSRRTEIRRVADALFDFNEMARLALSPHLRGPEP